MSYEKTVLFVGAHPDDIEIGCGGTVQVFNKSSITPVGLVMSIGHDKEDKRRRDAVLKSAELLGYVPEFGNIPSKDLTYRDVETKVAEVIEKYDPIAVFGHSPKDLTIAHKIVSTGTDSAARRVRSRIHFVGPEGESEFSPDIIYTFTEEEFNQKLAVLRLHRQAYGHARYFNRQWLGQNSWLGQRALQYEDRESQPYVHNFGEKRIPYGEGFEARHFVNPIPTDNIFFDSEMKELAKTATGTD